MKFRGAPSRIPAVLHKDRIGEVAKVDRCAVKWMRRTVVAVVRPFQTAFYGFAEVSFGCALDVYLVEAIIIGGGAKALPRIVRAAAIYIFRCLNAQILICLSTVDTASHAAVAIEANSGGAEGYDLGAIRSRIRNPIQRTEALCNL